VSWANVSASNSVKGFVAVMQPIMCDFEVVKDEENSNRFFITLMLAMENSRDTDKVLSFEISTVTQFEYRPHAEFTRLPEEDKKRWELFQIALDASISNARAYLLNYLAPTYCRSYILPMLDVADLVARKFNPARLPTVPSNAPSEQPEGSGKIRARKNRLSKSRKALLTTGLFYALGWVAGAAGSRGPPKKPVPRCGVGLN